MGVVCGAVQIAQGAGGSVGMGALQGTTALAVLGSLAAVCEEVCQYHHFVHRHRERTSHADFRAQGLCVGLGVVGPAARQPSAVGRRGPGCREEALLGRTRSSGCAAVRSAVTTRDSEGSRRL